MNTMTGQDEEQIVLKNNPTLNYAQLVLQPQTLTYGFYRFVYKVTMTYKTSNGTVFSNSAYTFSSIVASGLVLSSLKLSEPLFGGTVEITRGLTQSIEFDPFLFTYDIDSVAVITALQFKYACQIKDSNVAQGYPVLIGSSNKTIDLYQLKVNSSLAFIEKCFNSTSMCFFLIFQ